ncbi:MAG: hypothetical protein KDA96_14855, partial [Planctomycetaceae bacterium]|nr:hypothetical protein [Planctomycetaceae bacterium]
MKFVGSDDVRSWYTAASLSEFTRGIGGTSDPEADGALGIPDHLQFAIRQLAKDRAEPLPADAFDSIPFYSLCRGLFLPLSMIDPERAAILFGLKVKPPPDAAGRESLLADFLNRDVGLTLPEQIGCILGDVFLGGRSSVRRDSLVRLLMSMQLLSRRECLDRLTQVGDIAILCAESRPTLRSEQPLTSAEVIRTLRFLPKARQTIRFRVLRSLFRRCGKLEAYFLAKLLLQKAGLGFDYQGALIARLLAGKFRASEEQVAHAMALTDAFHVAEVLLREGNDGLRRIQLQPLVPVRPMLAGGVTGDLTPEEFPVWVERKYDGIRLLLHKSTDMRGSVLCGAYTRNRGDWLEQIAGLDVSIRQIPAASFIVDGELFGTVLDLEAGVRPASVYEVYASLQGQSVTSVSLRFAAFDLLYLNGMDLTSRPLQERRSLLLSLMGPVQGRPLPV